MNLDNRYHKLDFNKVHSQNFICAQNSLKTQVLALFKYVMLKKKKKNFHSSFYFLTYNYGNEIFVRNRFH